MMTSSGAARVPGQLAPGPRGYPLLGVFPRARRNPIDFLLESARRYGDVVAMRFGTRQVYLLSHPADIKHVLQDNHRGYGKSAPAARIGPLFGESLTAVDGDDWQRQRRMMRSVFQPRSLRFLLPIIAEATSAMLDRWQRIAERSEVLDVMSEMSDLTRAIIVQGLFGRIDRARARAVGQALERALEHADRQLWSPLGWLETPTPAHVRFRQALRTIDDFVDDMIVEARGRRTPSDTLAATLVAARDTETGERMSDRELHAEMKALMVAGHTTTASALAWTWYVLSEHAAVRQTLRRELATKLTGRAPGGDDLQGLPYTRMVVEEVLRLYPPTWLTARTPLQEDRIRDYRIAPGAIVLLSPLVTHRHPEFWEAPDRFDPGRFTSARSAGRPRFAYFPFGGGPRSCIGSWLASVTMQLVVGTVASRFEMAPVPGSRVEMSPGLTLRPRPGLPMTLRG